jgi:hypothetical protein
MKHAGEYWALAILKLERMQPSESLRSGVITSTPDVPERYDDTDLGQVTGLIKSFRGMGLEGI